MEMIFDFNHSLRLRVHNIIRIYTLQFKYMQLVSINPYQLRKTIRNKVTEIPFSSSSLIDFFPLVLLFLIDGYEETLGFPPIYRTQLSVFDSFNPKG